jgi:AmmeMemoRadiSam system protein A
MSPSPPTRLSEGERRTLLRIARETLDHYLSAGAMPPCAARQADSPGLRTERAAFVTLRRRDAGELRGCRGEGVARRALVESVAHMSVAAATDDPRFKPVTIDELVFVRIEISALRPMAPISPDEIELGRHGLAIALGRNGGLLLPQVPVAHGWDREGFLRAICRKAELPEDAWRAEGVRLLGFECEAWEEE